MLLEKLKNKTLQTLKASDSFGKKYLIYAMFIKIELQCQMSELERILMIILKILIDIRDLVSIRLVSCTRLFHLRVRKLGYS